MTAARSNPVDARCPRLWLLLRPTSCIHAVERPDPHRLPAIVSAQQRYARHRPEESLLYQTVEQHAEPFLSRRMVELDLPVALAGRPAP